MAIAVLDIGKSNVKLVLLDDEGATLWTRRQPNPVLPGPPYPHVDAEAIWSFATACLAEAARHHRITHLVTTAHGATGALVDEDGLVLPILDYEHSAPFEEDFGYRAVRPPFAEIQSPDMACGLNFGRQVWWQSHRFPEAFARCRHILMYPQYWAWRFSGVAAGEVTSLGAHADLWEPGKRRYSTLVDRAGWRHLLPPIRPAHASLGAIKPELASELGLPAECQVVCGIHDSNASLAPHLLSRPAPFTVVSTGTWVIIMAIGAQARLDEARDTLANVNLLGDPVSTARFMGGRDHEMIVPAGAPPATPADVAAIIAAECFVFPCLVQRCGPFPDSMGGIEGPCPDHPGARAALAALYLALMVDQCLDMIGAAGDVIVEGSFAANHVFAGLLAALRPGGRVLVSPDATGTSQGAAMLARWGAPHPVPAGDVVPPLAIAGLATYREQWLARVRGPARSRLPLVSGRA
jgi:L-fuculokinase